MDIIHEEYIVNAKTINIETDTTKLKSEIKKDTDSGQVINN